MQNLFKKLKKNSLFIFVAILVVNFLNAIFRNVFYRYIYMNISYSLLRITTTAMNIFGVVLSLVTYSLLALLGYFIFYEWLYKTIKNKVVATIISVVLAYIALMLCDTLVSLFMTIVLVGVGSLGINYFLLMIPKAFLNALKTLCGYSFVYNVGLLLNGTFVLNFINIVNVLLKILPVVTFVLLIVYAIKSGSSNNQAINYSYRGAPSYNNQQTNYANRSTVSQNNQQNSIEYIFCPNCGNKCLSTQAFCMKCGTSLKR